MEGRFEKKVYYEGGKEVLTGHFQHTTSTNTCWYFHRSDEGRYKADGTSTYMYNYCFKESTHVANISTIKQKPKYLVLL